jgi:ribosomal-protein-alanine N-acetyltransferase
VDLRIREFRREDLDQLWHIDQDCFEPGIAYSRLELAHYIRRPQAFTLVAERAQNGVQPDIVGFLVADSSRRNMGHIITLDVLQHSRRGGIGGLLMDSAEERLRQRGCDVVYLETAVNNAAAINFYKRRGYFLVKTLPRYYQGKLDGLLMAKSFKNHAAQSPSDVQ